MNHNNIKQIKVPTILSGKPTGFLYGCKESQSTRPTLGTQFIRGLQANHLSRCGTFLGRYMAKYSSAVRIIIAAFFLATVTLLYTDSTPAYSQGTLCSSQYYVDETLPSGARWQLCWEHRNLDGIVLYEIYFTPANGGSARQIMTEASVSQIHVPYDDNGARYHDVTDYGMGGANMQSLSAADCPNGTLLNDNDKNVLCKRTASRGHAYFGAAQQSQGYALSLFSVSPIGEYNYIPLWQFYDDGTIEVVMGASGKLQRRGSNDGSGWPIRSNNTSGISHIHNYYWRLDFDLNGTGNNDIVDEIQFVPADNNQRRELSITQLSNEADRSVDPENMRSWRIRDAEVNNSNGAPIAYYFEPLRTGHRDIGPSYEPWTNNDFYVTKHKDCEKYVSHNPTTGGCGSDITDFTNDESLNGQDVVIWYGTTFHHIPRDEDESYMHAHWDGFKIVPFDWTAFNSLTDGAAIPTTPVPATPTLETPVSATPVPAAATQIPATDTQMPQTNTDPIVCSTVGNDTAVRLNNGVSSIGSALNVTNGGAISDLNINIDMTHTWVGDLIFTLSHNGTDVAIFDQPGLPGSTYGCNGSDIRIKLDDQSGTDVEDVCASSAPSISGTYKPNNLLSAFNGVDSNGIWNLRIEDRYTSSDSGTLNNWSLEICAASDGTAPIQVPPTATSTLVPTNTPIPTSTPASADTQSQSSESQLYISSTTNGYVGGISFQDEDVLTYNNSSGIWAMYFDGSDVGLSNVDVDAFTQLDNGTILLSVDTSITLPGVGTIDDSDILLFTSDSTGWSTAGTWSMYLDGSDVGLSTDGEDVKAVHILNDGRILISTYGSYSVSGLSGNDEDLLAFTPAQLGGNTQGSWSLYFDGSDVGMTDSNDDIFGTFVDEEDGSIYLTTLGFYSVTGLNGAMEEIFRCTPISLGNNTSCTFSTFWNGGSFGFIWEQIDAIDIGPAQIAAASLQDNRAERNVDVEDIEDVDPED